jgi:hypothetical protein
LRIGPDGPGAALSKQLDGLDERLSVVRPDSLVADLVFRPIWCAGPRGKTIGKGDSVEVQHELAKSCVVSLGQPLQVLDERRSREVLPYNEIKSSAQLFAGQREAQPPGVQSRSQWVLVPTPERVFDRVDIQGERHRTVLRERGGDRRLARPRSAVDQDQTSHGTTVPAPSERCPLVGTPTRHPRSLCTRDHRHARDSPTTAWADVRNEEASARIGR